MAASLAENITTSGLSGRAAPAHAKSDVAAWVLHGPMVKARNRGSTGENATAAAAALNRLLPSNSGWLWLIALISTAAFW